MIRKRRLARSTKSTTARNNNSEKKNSTDLVELFFKTFIRTFCVDIHLRLRRSRGEKD